MCISCLNQKKLNESPAGAVCTHHKIEDRFNITKCEEGERGKGRGKGEKERGQGMKMEIAMKLVG